MQVNRVREQNVDSHYHKVGDWEKSATFMFD